MRSIQIKRVYDPFNAKDGFRILVDRLWPRGMKKEDAHVDYWMKSVAPSPALRKWFAHDPEKWDLFSKKYREELNQTGACNELTDFIQKYKRITLLYAARDVQHNHAVVLEQLVLEHFL